MISNRIYIAGIWRQVKKILSGGYLLAFLFVVSQAGGSERLVEVLLAGKPYRIELATTAEQRQRGLMGRPSLAPDRGMLLVYRYSGDHRIWMKNVLIPLRVYWLDDNYSIVDYQRLEPCSASPCPVYAARSHSRYVLELGDYEHDLTTGDTLDEFRDL